MAAVQPDVLVKASAGLFWMSEQTRLELKSIEDALSYRIFPCPCMDRVTGIISKCGSISHQLEDHAVVDVEIIHGAWVMKNRHRPDRYVIIEIKPDLI